MRNVEFVNYTATSGLRSRKNSRQVASYVGRYHRNRSAPSSQTTIASNLHRVQRPLAPTVRHPIDRSAVGLQSTSLSLAPTAIPRDRAGYREDPFDALPIRQNKSVSIAIDYYIFIYAPSHLTYSNSIRSRDRMQFVQRHFQDVLCWPTMFEAVLALAYSNLATMNAAQSTLNILAINHYGKAISLLRHSIRDGVAGEAELFSIVSLMGVNYLWDDLNAFQTNLRGLRQILAWRGGLNSLKWVDLLEPAILTIEAFWVYISQQTHLSPQSSLSVTPIAIDVSEAADYEVLVSALPTRFQQLARQQRLSLDVVRAILEEVEFSTSILYNQPAGFVHHDGVRKFASLRTKSGEDINIVSHIQTIRDLARLFGSSHLTREDVVCCIGMFINALCVLRSEQLSPVFFKQLQHHTRQLIECEVDVNDTIFRDLLAWAMFNVASTMAPSRTIRSADSPLSDLRHHLLSKIVSLFPTSQWHDLKLILNGFITSDTCLTVFEQVWNLALQQKSSVA